jgi:hypothetical protein
MMEVPNRRGLVTQASVMATLAESNRTNPIHRGAFFQEEVLCNDLPSLPGDVDTQTPLEDTSMLPTARERLSPLMENADCAGCHEAFNPTGFAFENYDAVGAWRTEENGSTIDSSGSIWLDGEQVEFANASELMDAVASSEQAEACYSLQWFRNAVGRKEYQEDACSIALVEQAARASGGDIREIVLAITQTDAFLYRTMVEN